MTISVRLVGRSATSQRVRGSYSRSARRFAVILAVAVAIAGFVTPAAEAADDPVLTITGHGWGHGRGMGQYGALGYATDQGWSAAQILDHYYGGTTSGQVPAGAPVDPNRVRVDLRFMRGRATTVGLGSGTIVAKDVNGAELARIGDGAVRVTASGSGFDIEASASCDGPWAKRASSAGTNPVTLVADSAAGGLDGALMVCGGFRVWYEGEIQAAIKGSRTHTVNVVTVEQYLRGVVPNEVPASWHEAALQAQAVAARSYVMAGDSRQQPFADTCDTTLCQVYDGIHTTRGGNRSATHSRTDAAIKATAGVVRLRDGKVARTEFSSSTGGHTVGGAFTAVADAGDSTAQNPNHDWTVQIDPTVLEQRYGQGELKDIVVSERNGLGEDGGRAVKVTMTFAKGTVTRTGNQIRQALGLKSDWFSISYGAAVPVTEGHEQFIKQSFATFTGRAASDAEIAKWGPVVANGDKVGLTSALVTDAHFSGQFVDRLYRRALRREPEAGGKTYWLGKLKLGLPYGRAGAAFFGSKEFYLRAGGTNSGFVTALYRDLLGREPDASGQKYWEGLAAKKGVSRDRIVAGFYNSIESRRLRATVVHQLVNEADPSADKREQLAERLKKVDDLRLSAEVGADR